MSRGRQELAITSLGLVCAVGQDVVTAAAACRAGIVRRVPFPDFTASDDQELEAPLMVAATGAATGFIQSGTWARLGKLALDDLVRYGRLPAFTDGRFWEQTALLWLVPELEYERFLWPGQDVATLLGPTATRALWSGTGMAVAPPVKYYAAGAMGLALAVGEVPRLFEEGFKRILLLATDSYLDTLSLSWLSDRRRLKLGDQPVGLCPGEAAACLLIESPFAAQERAAIPQATLLAAAERAAPPIPPPAAPPDDGGDEEDGPDDGPSSQRAVETGLRLPLVIETALAAAGVALPFRGDVYVDLNGEVWRAAAWGQAQAALMKLMDGAACRLQIPAAELGDVGAASGLAGICLATRAFQRGYATAGVALVCSISDSGGVGAVVVRGTA